MLHNYGLSDNAIQIRHSKVKEMGLWCRLGKHSWNNINETCRECKRCGKKEQKFLCSDIFGEPYISFMPVTTFVDMTVKDYNSSAKPLKYPLWGIYQQMEEKKHGKR